MSKAILGYIDIIYPRLYSKYAADTQGHPWRHGKCVARLDYMKSNLKKENKKKIFILHHVMKKYLLVVEF